jgi:uncharacterized protein YggT (Ycf19 family)
MAMSLLLLFQIVSVYIKWPAALNLMIWFQDDNFIEESDEVLEELCAETFNV